MHPGDTEATLHERIKQVERRLYPATMWTFIARRRVGGHGRGALGAAMRALLSVYDKEGLSPSPGAWTSSAVELISSGGTSAELDEAGIAHLESPR